jgi:hypothetical protein
MFDHSTRIYQQGLIVLDSSVGVPELPPAAMSAGDFGWGFSTLALHAPSLTESISHGVDFDSQVVRTTFSSVPVLWASELTGDYQELGVALREITELDDDDEWHVDPPVYVAAGYIASELLRMSFPAPRIFNHGPKSVVFNWSSGANNLYLTISADRMSALISSPDRIERRIDYSAKQLADPSLALFSIEAAYSGKPVERVLPGTTPDPQEICA